MKAMYIGKNNSHRFSCKEFRMKESFFNKLNDFTMDSELIFTKFMNLNLLRVSFSDQKKLLDCSTHKIIIDSFGKHIFPCLLTGVLFKVPQCYCEVSSLGRG
jgi:hypothetical protein